MQNKILGKLFILSTVRTIRIIALVSMLATSASAQPRSNIVIQWNQALMQGVRDGTLGPPMVARALAIVHTCMYDAWAAYDRKAVGTQLGGSLRTHPSSRALVNKRKAISFAAYRAAVDLFPWDKVQIFDPLMASLGYDINDVSADTTTPPESAMSRVPRCSRFGTVMVPISWGI
jgi:hypothetical protein